MSGRRLTVVFCLLGLQLLGLQILGAQVPGLQGLGPQGLGLHGLRLQGPGLPMPVVAAAEAGGAPGQPPRVPLAGQGELDLSGWDWQRGGTIRLDGEWEFFWHQLLEPGDFGGSQPVAAAHWIRVPGAWNGYDLDGQVLPGTGYATFRIRVRLPAEPEPLALHIPYERTAYRLWVNGQELAANGLVGVDPARSRPQYLPATVSVQPPADTLELVMQVSNFHHRSGGLWNSVLLGRERDVARADTLRVALRSLLIGLLLGTGTYHLLMYSLRASAVANLYFGLLALLMAMKTAVTGELLLMRFVPEFPWRALLTAEYLAYEVGLPVFFSFLRALFPEDVPRSLVWTSVGVGAALSARTMLLPTILTSRVISLDQASSVLFGLATLLVLGRAVRKGRNHAPLFLGSCILWLAAIVNDILYANGLPSTGLLLTPLGILAFVLGMTVVLAREHQSAFRAQEELAAHNSQLAERLAQHLRELREARRVLASQDSKVRKRIAEALHGRVQNRLLLAQFHLAQVRESLSAEQGETARRLAEVESRLQALREQEIRRLSHLLHPAVVSVGLIPAVEELTEEYAGLLKVQLRLDPQLARLDNPVDGRIPEATRLTVYRALAEALQNVAAHSGARSVTVELGLLEGKAIAVRVHDDGRGFDLGKVQPGLGLPTIGAYVTESGGSWELHSEEGAGTTLQFQIPLEWAS